jgi:hypothetical protein
MIAAALLVALAAVAASSPAFADGPRRVAVVVALTVNATEDRALELSKMLGEAIARELEVEVIAGDEVAAALGGAEISDGCIAEEACMRRLGERLGADELIAIVVVELGSRTQLEPAWIDTASGRSVSRSAISFEEGEDPLPLFRERAPTLLPDAARRLPVADVAVEPDPEVEAWPASSQEDRRISPLAWTAASAGVAALGGGIGFAAATRSLYRRCEAGGCDEGDRLRIRRRAVGADVLLATAAVAGGVAAVAYLRGGARPVGERGASVEVGVGPGEVGFSLRGRF